MKDPLPVEEKVRNILKLIPGTSCYKAELCGASLGWTYTILTTNRNTPRNDSSATRRYRTACNALDSLRMFSPIPKVAGPNLRWMSPSLCAELGVKYRP